MFRLSWLQKRGPTRETLRRDQTRRRRWPGLGLLVCLAFLQSGCQSGPSCGGCSGLFSPCGFFSRVSNRVFDAEHPQRRLLRPDNRFGRPYRGMVRPRAWSLRQRFRPYPKRHGTLDDLAASDRHARNPGRDSEGQDRPTAQRRCVKLEQPELERPAIKPDGSVPGSGIARYRNESVARTMVSTPEPTSRSAQAASTEVVPAVSGSDVQDPLDHLPPLDLPGEVTRSSASPTPLTPPAAPVAERNRLIPPRTSPGRVAKVLPPPAWSTPAAAPTPVAEPSPSASIGPGLTRFVAVDLKLAGGGAPSAAGLQWLVEKGYRTLLDLREPSEVPSSFIAEVTNKGLRYVALPMSLKTIDRDHVDRFHFEIAAGEARPLFFFDSNGTRAGALWYIRRIVVDRVDPQIARREAEELGLVDETAWMAATDYVAKIGSPRAGSSSSEARSPSVASPGPSSGQTPAQKAPETSSQASTAAAQPTFEPARTTVGQPRDWSRAGYPAPTHSVSPASPPRRDPGAESILHLHPTPASPSDPLAWRPFAAMVLTGLSLPLAYWSRSIVPTILAKTRASLPAPALRPKSLPDESDG